MKLVCRTLAMLIVFALCSPVLAKEKESAIKFGTDPVVASIKPKRPVSVTLKRLKDGSYTWVLEGDDVDEIIRIDNKLKKSLNIRK